MFSGNLQHTEDFSRLTAQTNEFASRALGYLGEGQVFVMCHKGRARSFYNSEFETKTDEGKFYSSQCGLWSALMHKGRVGLLSPTSRYLQKVPSKKQREKKEKKKEKKN